MTTSEPAPKRSKPSPRANVQRVALKSPDWGYAHLQLVDEPRNEVASVADQPDILTWRTTLMAALTQFLGIVGSGMHVDILHLQRDEAWVRLPRTDLPRFAAALSGYVGAAEPGHSVGFRVRGTADFLMGLVGKDAERDVWAE